MNGDDDESLNCGRINPKIDLSRPFKAAAEQTVVALAPTATAVRPFTQPMRERESYFEVGRFFVTIRAIDGSGKL